MAGGALIAGPVDTPRVILIHGLGGTHHTWDRVVPLIKAQASVLAIDLAGSDSIEHEADQAAELIGPARPAVLVGHSRGGLVATAIAERHPKLALKLILLCTPWAVKSRLVANRPVERALATPGIGQLLWTAATDTQLRRGLATAFAAGTPVPDKFVADLRATGQRRFVAASRAIDTYLAEAPLAERLANCQAPADVIFGELDARVAPPPTTTLTHITLTGVGHTPPWEAPDRVADLIMTSLNGHGHDPTEDDTRADDQHGLETQQ